MRSLLKTHPKRSRTVSGTHLTAYLSTTFNKGVLKVRINISSEALHSSKLRHGDKVDILFGNDGLCIITAHKDGYTISGKSNGPGAIVLPYYEDFFCPINPARVQVFIADGEMMFEVPSYMYGPESVRHAAEYIRATNILEG